MRTDMLSRINGVLARIGPVEICYAAILLVLLAALCVRIFFRRGKRIGQP